MIETTVIPERRLVIHRFGDRFISGADGFEELERLVARPDFECGFNIVMDLRLTRVSLRDMVHPPKEFHARLNEVHTSKIAWVIHSRIILALVKLLYSQHQWESTWKMFDTIEEALDWCVT